MEAVEKAAVTPTIHVEVYFGGTSEDYLCSLPQKVNLGVCVTACDETEVEQGGIDKLYFLPQEVTREKFTSTYMTGNTSS